MGCHDVRIIQVPAINYDGIFQFRAQAREIERGELFPLGQNEDGISLMRRLRQVARIFLQRVISVLGEADG